MLKTEVIGLKDTIKVLEKVTQEAEEHIQREINKSATNTLSDSKNTLSREGKHVTGLLIASGKVLTKPGQATVKYNSKYAFWVENGRRANSKPPPIQPIADWVRKKGLAGTYSIKSRKRTGSTKSQEAEDRQAAIFISKKIGKRGIKKTPFLYPAFFREKEKLKGRLSKIIKTNLK